MMIHRCLLAAVCTAMCALPGATVAEDVPCLGGGLEFLQSKWAYWFRLHDINKDGTLTVTDWTDISDRIGRQRGYTSQQTQDLKEELTSAMSDYENATEVAHVGRMTRLYVNDNIMFHQVMNATFTALVTALLQSNGTRITDADLDLIVEAMEHPEFKTAIAVYVHDDSGLTLDKLIAFLVDYVSNPCPT